MKLCWVTLHVADFKKSLEFYHEHLGLPIVSKVETEQFTMAMLGEKGEFLVELIVSPDSGAPASKAIGIGIAVQNLDRSLEKLEAVGYPQVGEIVSPSPNYRFGFVEDPNGNTVQLVEEV